ncbi:MAG: DUF2796 domain-containing protein [Proteobacteria bacterium]|nr:DUF2796 domain-containing protein [Pseudomonadota bacterium]
MKSSLFVLFLLLGSLAFAKKGHKHHHHAHEHGAAELALAFEGLNGKVSFKAAAEGVLGFEHAPKSEKHKKIHDSAIAAFENDIGKMIQMDPALGCVFKKEKIEQVIDGTHSDFVADLSVNCRKSVDGSKVTFDFTQFKGLKDIEVTILSGGLQKSVEVKRKPVSVELKSGI